MKIAILFPGQGSQFVGMGQEFVESDSSCGEILKMAEAACELPLGDIIRNGPMERLTQANHLQPAITVTNLICWQALQNGLPAGADIHCLAGHSLGEYSALHAAGVLSAEDTMRLVAKRGAVMDREGKKNPGGMRALLGLTIEEVEELINSYSGEGCVTAANHNCEQQIVISGSNEAVDAIGDMATEKGAKSIALAVTVANHSPLVAGAVPDFMEFMANIEFKSPTLPVYCNVSAGKETDSATIKEMMAKQIISRVRWYEIICAMLEDGVDTFIEAGPKPVLKGMMRKIVPKGVKFQALQFDSPKALDKIIKDIS